MVCVLVSSVVAGLKWPRSPPRTITCRVGAPEEIEGTTLGLGRRSDQPSDQEESPQPRLYGRSTRVASLQHARRLPSLHGHEPDTTEVSEPETGRDLSAGRVLSRDPFLAASGGCEPAVSRSEIRPSRPDDQGNHKNRTLNRSRLADRFRSVRNALDVSPPSLCARRGQPTLSSAMVNHRFDG